jgi:hypothetical protein
VNDNDVTPELVAPMRIATSAFGQTMIGVETLCGRLAMAIAAHDFDRVIHSAREATSMWFTGHAACRRFVERSTTSSPHADAARRLLEENYMKLLELFEQAARTIDVPRMRRTLGDLRVTLVTSIAQRLSADERRDTHGQSDRGHHDGSV